MKSKLLVLMLLQICFGVFADTLPIITTQPQSQTISGTASATLSVVSSNATAYQWRFNGADISGATNSTLQTSTEGYYLVIVKNSVGWVPSQMAYVSLLFATTTPPMPTVFIQIQTNQNLNSQILFGGNLISTGTAQIVAGPELDQMQPVGAPIPIVSGHFTTNTLLKVPNATSNAYYSIFLTGDSFELESTVAKTTGVGLTTSLGIPAFAEWPEPIVVPALQLNQIPQQTNIVQLPGENATLSVYCICYNEYGLAAVQWRKDGRAIPGATNVSYFTTQVGDIQNSFSSTITITNIQGTNAGVYDAEILGDNWIVGPKIQLSVQTTNGTGVFQSPRLNSTNFVSDLVGAPTRNYTVQWSTNLTTWNDLVTLSNSTGTVTFTNAVTLSGSAYFYRTKLAP